MAAIAFLVDGAASAHAAREAAAARRTEGYTATPTGELEPGVVEDVPVEGDPRALATVGAGPLFMAGLAAGLGIGTKITLLATIGVLTIGVAILGGRRHWLRALGDLARRHGDHLRLLVRAELRLRAQPVPADPQARPDPPARPGPARPLSAPAAHR